MAPALASGCKVLTKDWCLQDAAKPRDVVRHYDSLLGSVRELRAAAANLGGSAGELLLDACTAAVRPRSAAGPQRLLTFLGTLALAAAAFCVPRLGCRSSQHV